MPVGLSQIFHQDLGIATVTELGDTFLTDLAHTLTCETQLVADLFKPFFMATDAEALTDNGDLSVFQYFIEHGV